MAKIQIATHYNPFLLNSRLESNMAEYEEMSFSQRYVIVTIGLEFNNQGKLYIAGE